MFNIALKFVSPNEKSIFIKSSKWYKFMYCMAKYTRKYTKNGLISTKSMRGIYVENGHFVWENFKLKFPKNHRYKPKFECIIVLA